MATVRLRAPDFFIDGDNGATRALGTAFSLPDADWANVVPFMPWLPLLLLIFIVLVSVVANTANEHKSNAAACSAGSALLKPDWFACVDDDIAALLPLFVVDSVGDDRTVGVLVDEIIDDDADDIVVDGVAVAAADIDVFAGDDEMEKERPVVSGKGWV